MGAAFPEAQKRHYNSMEVKSEISRLYNVNGTQDL